MSRVLDSRDEVDEDGVAEFASAPCMLPSHEREIRRWMTLETREFSDDEEEEERDEDEECELFRLPETADESVKEVHRLLREQIDSIPKTMATKIASKKFNNSVSKRNTGRNSIRRMTRSNMKRFLDRTKHLPAGERDLVNEQIEYTTWLMNQNKEVMCRREGDQVSLDPWSMRTHGILTRQLQSWLNMRHKYHKPIEEREKNTSDMAGPWPNH